MKELYIPTTNILKSTLQRSHMGNLINFRLLTVNVKKTYIRPHNNPYYHTCTPEVHNALINSNQVYFLQQVADVLYIHPDNNSEILTFENISYIEECRNGEVDFVHRPKKRRHICYSAARTIVSPSTPTSQGDLP